MVDDTSVKTPMQRHKEFAVSALIGVAALVVALLLKAPLPYSIRRDCCTFDVGCSNYHPTAARSGNVLRRSLASRTCRRMNSAAT